MNFHSMYRDSHKAQLSELSQSNFFPPKHHINKNKTNCYETPNENTMQKHEIIGNKSQQQQASLQYSRATPERVPESQQRDNKINYYGEYQRKELYSNQHLQPRTHTDNYSQDDEYTQLYRTPSEYPTHSSEYLTHPSEYLTHSSEYLTHSSEYPTHPSDYPTQDSEIYHYSSINQNAQQSTYMPGRESYIKSYESPTNPESNDSKLLYYAQNVHDTYDQMENANIQSPQCTSVNNHMERMLQNRIYPTNEANRLNYTPSQSNVASAAISGNNQEKTLVETRYSQDVLNAQLQPSHTGFQNLEQNTYSINQSQPTLNNITSQHEPTSEIQNYNYSMKPPLPKQRKTPEYTNSIGVTKATPGVVNTDLKQIINTLRQPPFKQPPKKEPAKRKKYQTSEKTVNKPVRKKREKKVKAENIVQNAAPQLGYNPNDTYIMNQQILTQMHEQNKNFNYINQNHQEMNHILITQPRVCATNNILTNQYNNQNNKINPLTDRYANSPQTQYQPENQLQNQRITNDREYPSNVEIRRSVGIQPSTYLSQNIPTNYSQNLTVSNGPVYRPLPKLGPITNKSPYVLSSQQPYPQLHDSRLGNNLVYNCKQGSDPISFVYPNNLSTQKLPQPQLQDGYRINNHLQNQTPQNPPYFENTLLYPQPSPYNNVLQQKNTMLSTTSQQGNNNNNSLTEKAAASPINRSTQNTQIYKQQYQNLNMLNESKLASDCLSLDNIKFKNEMEPTNDAIQTVEAKSRDKIPEEPCDIYHNFFGEKPIDRGVAGSFAMESNPPRTNIANNDKETDIFDNSLYQDRFKNLQNTQETTVCRGSTAENPNFDTSPGDLKDSENQIHSEASFFDTEAFKKEWGVFD